MIVTMNTVYLKKIKFSKQSKDNNGMILISKYD